MEGYIGGGLLTVILGVAFTQFCVKYGYPSLICPAEANNNFLSNLLTSNDAANYQPFLYASECKIPDVFLPQSYEVRFANFMDIKSFICFYTLEIHFLIY